MTVNTVTKSTKSTTWRREQFPLLPTDEQVTTSFKCSADLMAGTMGDRELRKTLQTYDKIGNRSRLFDTVMRLIVRFPALVVYTNEDGVVVGMKLGITE
jgi:hypothetical protein